MSRVTFFTFNVVRIEPSLSLPYRIFCTFFVLRFRGRLFPSERTHVGPYSRRVTPEVIPYKEIFLIR